METAVTQMHPKQLCKWRLTAAVVVLLVFAGFGCSEEDRPPDPFVGMYDQFEYGLYHSDLMAGFLWIEEPCIYFRMPEPIPIDIQSVADLDLDLEKAAASIASRLTESINRRYSDWVPADVQIVSESEPAHRMLLRLHRGSTRYDRATGQLWTGGGGPYSSGDFVHAGTQSGPLSEEYRSLGCDAFAQTDAGFYPSEVSEWYRSWR